MAAMCRDSAPPSGPETSATSVSASELLGGFTSGGDWPRYGPPARYLAHVSLPLDYVVELGAELLLQGLELRVDRLLGDAQELRDRAFR